MRTLLTILTSLVAAALLAGCATTPQPVVTRQELAFHSISAPTTDMSGRWSAEWTDPRARFKEAFTMDLVQQGNRVTGKAVFRDFDRTRCAIDGQVSSNEVRLVFSPQNNAIHESTWIGVVDDRRIAGTWHLHGQPPRGAAMTGPWEGRKK